MIARFMFFYKPGVTNGVAYGLKGLAQKEARGSRVLTEGLRWTDCGAGEPTSLTGGGMLAVAVDGSK